MAIVGKAKRGRPPAFNRTIVLERAMQVFWSNGYDNASVPLLTAAMGISAQSLYAAFGSKEALYREALELYRGTIGGFAVKALEEPDAIEAITRVLRDAATTFARTEGEPGCMIAGAPGHSTHPDLMELGRALRRESTSKVAARLKQGVREKQLREDLDVAGWAAYISTVVQGISTQARDGASPKTLLSIARAAAQVFPTLRTSGLK